MGLRVEENALEELLELLRLEPMEENRFRGRSQDLGYETIFGGQVLAQALAAAYQTVPSGRKAHSLHAYFLRAGDARASIVFEVHRIRDGGSFTTRRIVAHQNGQALFNMSASFQVDEPGFDHQDQAPTVAGPEGLENELELLVRIGHATSHPNLARILRKKPIEMRPVEPMDPLFPEKREPKRYMWLKAVGAMPDDFKAHQYLLAYASDFNLGMTSLYPHGHSHWKPDIQAASLDHAMWFHREFRVDEWLLYVMESPSASKARGLSYGKIYTRAGELVASVAQEAMIRQRGRTCLRQP